jgi:hypothetical protein
VHRRSSTSTPCIFLRNEDFYTSLLFIQNRYETLLGKLPAVADMFKTRFCCLFPAGAKSLIETSREFVEFL